MKLIPIMFGIVSGYVVCLFPGLINFQPVLDAKWFELPQLTKPEFNLETILYMLPIAIAPAVEHVGGIMAKISSVTGKDFLKNQAYIAHLIRRWCRNGCSFISRWSTKYHLCRGNRCSHATRNFNP